MVMGPDCGTSIVNGIPLGFANVVRRGPIGVVGASGTGTQEVTVRIHQVGSGVSQALGTGGHDLAEAIGGISMLHGLAALDGDPDTKVIVLVSKPPAEAVAAKVLAAAEASAKPVVVIFLGADPAADHPQRRVRRRLSGAGRRHGRRARPAASNRSPSDITIGDEMRNTLREKAACDGPAPAVRARASSPAARSASKRNWSTAARASAHTRTPRSTAIRHSTASPGAWRTPSSTWATTSSPRAARTR